MSLQSFFNRAITVEAPVDARDPSGGDVRDWAGVPFAINVPASVQPLTARERFANAQRQVFLSHRVYTDFDTGARRHCRVTDLETGQVFVVEATRDAAGQRRLYEMEVREQTLP